MIDFEIAKTWHRMYAETLQLVAAGDTTFTQQQVSDDANCTLGKWLYGAGRSLDGIPAYRQLLEAHQNFHDVACQYLGVALGAGEDRHKQAIAADLASVSAGVIAAIDRLRDAVAVPAAPAAPVVWEERLTIGLPVIDAHHKAIAEIIAVLMRDPDASLHSEFAVDNLTDLGKILTLHFSIEENYMRQLGMSADEFEAHRKRHQEILEQWARMNIASYANRELKVKDIAALVRDWAVSHVVEYDLGMKKYLPAELA